MTTLLLKPRKFNKICSNQIENLKKPNTTLQCPPKEPLLSGLKNKACICAPLFLWIHPKCSCTFLIHNFTLAHAIIWPLPAGRELRLVAL